MIAGLYGSICLVLQEAAKLSSKVAILFCIPASNECVFCCSTSSQHLVLTVFWNLTILKGQPGNFYFNFSEIVLFSFSELSHST